VLIKNRHGRTTRRSLNYAYLAECRMKARSPAGLSGTTSSGRL
jgi:hypothetical protein